MTDLTPRQRRVVNEAMRTAFNDWVELRQDYVTLAQALNTATARALRELRENRDCA